MSGVRSGTGLPVMVVPHGYRSVPPLELAAAAAGVCDLVWLVHASEPEHTAVGRLLQRLGHVVDMDGLDTDQVAAAVAPYRPRGVVAFRDEDLIPMADLAVALDLTFHRPSVARRLVDKVEQRRALRAAGLPVPTWWEIPAVRDAASVATVADRVTYPAVVKPRQGSGSRHTFAVQTASELVAALERLAGNPEDDEAMIVEQYLPSAPDAHEGQFADYVSVESLVTRDGLQHVAVTGRLHPAAPFRETGFFVPSDLGSAKTGEVLATATASLAALLIRFGCVHTEIKLTPDGPRVIEVNGRIGGGVRDMVLTASGKDLLALHLRSALGQPVDVDGLVACRRIGYRLFHQPPLSARRVRSVGGLADIGALPGVDAVSLHWGPGDPVDAGQGTRSFVFSVTGSTDDHGDLAETNRRVHELADVAYDHEGQGAAHRAIESVGVARGPTDRTARVST